MTSYYDPAKLAAALAAQAPGADGRTILSGQNLLSIMNSIGAPTQTAAGGLVTGDNAGASNGDGGYTGYATQFYNPATYANGLQDIGYGGTYTSQDDYNKQVAALETSLGLTPGQQYTYGKYDNPSGNGDKDQAIVYYDANGNPVAANNQYNPSNWVNGGRDFAKAAALIAGSAFGAQALAGAGVGGSAAAAGAGEGAAGAGAGAGGGLLDAGVTAGAGGAAGGGAAGTGALGYGVGYTVPAGYGGLAGLTDAQLAAASLAAGGGTSAATLAAGGGAAGGGGASAGATGVTGTTGTTAGTATGAAGAAAPAAGGTGGATASAAGAAGSLLPGVSNGTLLSTAGGLLGAAVGAVGSKNGLNSATTTNQSTVDPRVGQYVYGADGNSGLLGNVNSIMNSQLATGGLNATQTAGLNQQLAAYNDPAYTAGLQSMRTAGAGLLSPPVAGNPFTSGQASLAAQNPAGTTSAPMPAGWTPLQTQLNQKPRPNVTGLLGAYGT